MEVLERPIIEFHAVSDIGCGRRQNQDYWGLLEDQGLYVVADGIGGAPAGDLASKMAVDIFLDSMQRCISLLPAKVKSDHAASLLRFACKTANDSIYRKSCSERSLRGMGTTLSALYFLDSTKVLLAHVGDSRAYCLRGEHLVQLSRDNCTFAKKPLYTKEKLVYKRLLTKALGQKSSFTAHVEIFERQLDDFFVLCTDGLSDYLRKSDIQKLLQKKLSLEEKTKSLVNTAIERGGLDNITVIVVNEQRTQRLALSR